MATEVSFSGYLVLALDLVLCAVIVVLAGCQVYKGGRVGEAPTVSLTGKQARNLFLSILGLASALRVLSLLVDLVVRPKVYAQVLQPSYKTWVNNVLLTLPSLVYLSSYSVIVLFWAQVYHASSMRSHYPVLKAWCWFLNLSMYLVFLVMALLTMLLGAWREVRGFFYFFEGLLYCGLSWDFFYYGIKVRYH